MTSRRSFWDKCKENNKRRIWVWIVSILSQIIIYPCLLFVYLSRIRSYEANGYYNTVEEYKQALAGAVADAAAFQNGNGRVVVIVMLLAVVIGLQGFGWLHDRRKLDLYKSVPVGEKDRFFAIYINSMLIYALPYLLSMVLSIIIAATQGALTDDVFAKCMLAIVTNLLFFTVNLHLTILVMTITGNWLIACAGIGVLNMLDEFCYSIFQSLEHQFFRTAGYYFSIRRDGFCTFFEYIDAVERWKRQTNISALSRELLPVFAKWILYAIVLVIPAYLCYRKRPAEAAGKAIAFPFFKPFIKIVVAVVGAVGVACIIYASSNSNAVISILALIGSAILFGGILEVIYEFDIKAAIRHLFSTGCAAVIALAIFCIYQFDIFGYDTYLPDMDKVESAALFSGSYVQNYWEYMDEIDENGMPIGKETLSGSEYLRDNMFLADVEAVTDLAEKGIEFSKLYYQNVEEQGVAIQGRAIQTMSILYRMRSGRKVTRSYLIDLSDPEIAGILDRIIGTQEYREGNYLLAKHSEYLSDPAMRMYYTNGSMQAELSPTDAEIILEAWMTDMEQYDYTFALENDMCGEISVMFGGYFQNILPVYEDFVNTIAVLSERNAYYPLLLDVSDVASLTVTNYNLLDSDSSGDSYYDYAQATALPADADDRTVIATYENPEQIEAILKVIYPTSFDQEWKRVDSHNIVRSYLDTNYVITIAFKQDTDYPYKKVQDTFSPKRGCLPGFVVRDTVYKEK